MIPFILRRLLLAIPLVLVSSLLVFGIFSVSKVDPVRRMLGERSQDEALVQFERDRLGLNDPAHVRYGRFLKGIFTGDFGTSMRTGRTVVEELGDRLPATVELGGAALLLSLLFGLSAGILAGLNRNTPVDYAAMGASMLAVSLPVFWLALLMSYFFSERLGWLPLDGRYGLIHSGAIESVTGLRVVDALIARRWDVLADALRHLVLPASALAMVTSALVARMTRSSILEVVRQDWVRTAEAKGVGPLGRLRHILRNALVPVITIVGLEIPALLGGAVITETIFSWPGIGSFLIESILFGDIPAVQGLIMFLTIVFVIVNIGVDLAYAAVDPRIRID
jgi:peptide/nickel transport system permease protein